MSETNEFMAGFDPKVQFNSSSSLHLFLIIFHPTSQVKTLKLAY